mmetsp:Transcript_20214/g.40285  ORF Transcript_20214/g.40285 Transcript_20214/m.40285 type:complete len:201 (-) Transcript_20214:1840-2442(-)
MSQETERWSSRTPPTEPRQWTCRWNLSSERCPKKPSRTPPVNTTSNLWNSQRTSPSERSSTVSSVSSRWDPNDSLCTRWTAPSAAWWPSNSAWDPCRSLWPTWPSPPTRTSPTRGPPWRVGSSPSRGSSTPPPWHAWRWPSPSPTSCGPKCRPSPTSRPPETGCTPPNWRERARACTAHARRCVTRSWRWGVASTAARTR